MKLIFSLFSGTVAILVVFLIYMGAFSKIAVTEQAKGPYTYAYVEHIGPYEAAGKVMLDLDSTMRKLGFNSTIGIGIYYDDPKITPAEKLRSDLGSIINTEDMRKMNASRDKLKFKVLEKKTYLVAEFPIRNRLSYMMGPMFVYPAFEKYREDKQISAPTRSLELYDVPNKKIVFMMELESLN